MLREPGDRRSRVRFEVFGAFWGTFEAGDAVRVRNLTRHGALIEATEPLAVESIQSVCLTLDGQPALADARVRHVSPARTLRGAIYLVGVEFISTSSTFLEAVERLITYRASRTETA
ncbi:MAG TPA: PilZ domain-containing protein [Vicinamibacterales bacterium]|nr:PilZ domain-containing protein [Vicinamibacterales bacterium]